MALPSFFQGEPGKAGEKGLPGAPGLRVSASPLPTPGVCWTPVGRERPCGVLLGPLVGSMMPMAEPVLLWAPWESHQETLVADSSREAETAPMLRRTEGKEEMGREGGEMEFRRRVGWKLWAT